MYLSASVLTYNGAAYIKKQLDSILTQTQKVDEIVICDDGSTDDTISIIQAYQNNYPGTIHLYQNEQQLGSTKNMEKCLGLVKGDIVFLADQDDSWLPNKVATLCAFFEANPNMDAVFSNATLINEKDAVLPELKLWDIIGFPEATLNSTLNTIPNSKSNSTLTSEFNLFEFLYRVDNIVTGAGLAIRNHKALLTQPFPTVKGLLHDGWIALYYASQGKLAYCKDTLFQYRIHAAQQMGGNTTDPAGLLEMNQNLYASIINTNRFVQTKAYWNRLEQNLRLQNALTTAYQKIGVDTTELRKKMETQLKYYYELGGAAYPVRAKLRSIKKRLGF
jgi:glycosyltransferase involved in cell wall biosynthesis